MQEWRRQNGSAAVLALVPVSSSGADEAVYMLSVWLAPLPADVPWCRLYIVATDSGNLSTTTHVDLFIDDSAASPPPLTFTQTTYAASVSTDALPGTCLTTVHATSALITDQTPRSTSITTVPASASASACPAHYIVYTVAPPLLCYSYFIFYCFLFFLFLRYNKHKTWLSC